MSENSTYTITELSKSFKISEHTLRKYENDFKLKIPRNDLGHRYYTDKELDLFTRIIEWKNKGLNKTTIQGLLSRSIEAIEQEEQALELVTLDKLTGAEFKELVTKQIAQLMIEKEKEITNQYEEKLDKVKEELKEEVKQEFNRQQKQMEAENKKLMEYIAATKEEKKKSFWDLFKR